MYEIAAAAAGHCIYALFHASVHLLEHKTYDSVRKKIAWRLLSNHDVAKAMRRSYLGAVNLLRGHYRESASATRKGTASLRRLAGLVDDHFPNSTSSSAVTDAEAIELIGARDKQFPFAAELARQAREELSAPDDVVALIEEQFADAFAFAFTELGLKNNEQVRSVIVHSMLREVENTTEATLRSAIESARSIEEILEFQREFRAVLGNGLWEVQTQLASVIDSQSRLENAMARGPNSEERLWGYIVIADDSDTPQSNHPVTREQIIVGREKGDLKIADAGVSNSHLTLRFLDDGVVVRDLESSNGTRIDDQVITEETVPFGTRIRIGASALVVLSPMTPQRTLPVARTVRSS